MKSHSLIHHKFLLIFNGALYAAFLLLDFCFPEAYRISSILKYCGVLLCFLYVIFLKKTATYERDRIMVLVALFFTLISDAFLLFTTNYVWGVAVFCFAHVCYMGRYRRDVFHGALAATVILQASLFACALLKVVLPYLYILSGLYGLLILTNTISAFFPRLETGNIRYARAGMILFLLCDIHVALYHMLPAVHWYASMAGMLMWAFYLPAITLLALSCEKPAN